jgi:hypothetical protein
MSSLRDRIIIRIPRFKEEIDDDVAVLRYLEGLYSIPVPHVLRYDLTDANPLESPYMIQQYVYGPSLQQLMSTLRLEKRLEIVYELAGVTAAICATTFEHVGILRAIPNSSCVGFAMPQNSAMHEPFSNTLDFLIECYKGHSRNAQAIDPNDKWLPSYMEKLEAIARAFNMRRPFSNKFYLLHNDFMPRNVHVIENADGRPGIEAVLDWDGTTAAPIEAAYVVPHWLWTWSPEAEEGREEMADTMPKSADLRAAKQAFEEKIDLLIPGFMSTWRECSAARELFYFAINGLDYQDDAKRIDRLARLELPFL